MYKILRGHVFAFYILWYREKLKYTSIYIEKKKHLFISNKNFNIKTSFFLYYMPLADELANTHARTHARVLIIINEMCLKNAN